MGSQRRARRRGPRPSGAGRALDLACKALRRLSRLVFRKTEVLILEAPLCRVIKPLAPDLVIRMGNEMPDFLDKVRSIRPDRYRLFKRRLADPNVVCYVGDRKVGPMVGYAWFATKDFYEPSLRYTFRLQPHQVYEFDGYLAPEAREGMLALRILGNMQVPFREKGFTRALAGVDLRNRRNLLFHQYFGFKETGRKLVTYLIFTLPFTREVAYTQRYLRERKREREAAPRKEDEKPPAGAEGPHA